MAANTLRTAAATAAKFDSESVFKQLVSGKIKHHLMERSFPAASAAEIVNVRRRFLQEKNIKGISKLSTDGLALEQIRGNNAENVVGGLTLPVGVVGPYLINGKLHHIPMATTEGALIASTQRGATAITACGGVRTYVREVGMTRSPVVDMGCLASSEKLEKYILEHRAELAAEFNSTTRFGRLIDIDAHTVGRYVYLRFKAFTSDAMGMNMVSKGTEKVMQYLGREFSEMRLLALSGNVCSDKKAAGVNWIEGRGRRASAEAWLDYDTVRRVLKCEPKALVETHIPKNFIGSAIAGSLGGCNAHAANVVAAVYLATGQDCAQVVGSSMAMTIIKADEDTQRLYASVTMPAMELGTLGGGTTLPHQRACLEMMDLPQTPGQSANYLAGLICSTVLAGELSLMSALTEGSLVRAHMQLNRTPAASSTTTSAPPTPTVEQLASAAKNIRHLHSSAVLPSRIARKPTKRLFPIFDEANEKPDFKPFAFPIP